MHSVSIHPGDQFKPARSGRWWVYALTIGLLLGLALFFRTGVVGSDDTFYLEVARHMSPDHMPTVGPNFPARLAMWYPIRMATWFVGESWRALMWPPLLSAAIALTAVTIMGRRWFGGRAALLAVTALGLTTQFLVGATIALPDVVAAAAVSTALSLAGPGLLEEECRRPVLMALAGGVVIGLGFAAKEVAVLVGPAMGLFVLLRRTRCAWAWRRVAIVAVGTMAWLAFETTVLWYYTGDLLYHFNAVRDSQADYGAPQTATFVDLLNHWTQYVRWMLDPRSVFHWWGPLYLAAIGFAVWRPNDRVRLVLCVVVCLGLYLSVGSSDLGHYTLLWHQPRYLLPLMPPVALLLGYAADRVLQRRRVPGGLVAAGAACLCVMSLHWANQASGKWYAAREFSAGRALFEELDPPLEWRGRVCASGHTAYRLSLLFEQAGVGSVTRIGRPPQSAEEWTLRFGGAYLVVSSADRRPPPLGQKMCLLDDRSIDTLAAFERLAWAAPPSSRAREVFAALRVVEPRRDENERVEVYLIPEPRMVSLHE